MTRQQLYRMTPPSFYSTSLPFLIALQRYGVVYVGPAAMENPFYDKNGNIIDYYTIFGIGRDADGEEVRSAFRRLIKQYHPDLSPSRSEHLIEKIDVIIRGYRILCDEGARRDYDRELFASDGDHSGAKRIVSKKRIRYSTTLTDMLRARLRPGHIKRRDILYNLGQDIEIFITPLEAGLGVTAYIELPARMYCPLCSGGDSGCYLCSGVGRIHTTSQLEVRIPPHVDDSTFIDIDLLKVKPDNLTSFAMKSLRIKITIISKKEAIK